MKIALVILRADPARGGAERYTIDLAAALARAGEDVAILASEFADLPTGVQKIHIPARAATRLGRYERFVVHLNAHWAHQRYDVVHAMLPVPRCDIYHPHAGVAADAVRAGHLKYNSPTRRAAARLANQLNRKRLRFAAVERALLTGARPPVVLCLSDYVKATLRRHYTLDDSRLATLFNAVDLEKFDPAARPEAGGELRTELSIEPERVVALIIAQDFERKGLAEAIAALARVKDDRLTLVVVGKQNPTRYRRLAAKWGVEASRVVFAGTTGDPYRFYSAADLFILPTRHDPCSLATLEALAMGIPVISTRCNGACEIMADGVHGHVLDDPTDVPALAAALTNLLHDRRRQAMGEACLALRPRLAYGRHLADLLAIYRKIAASPGPVFVSPSPNKTG